LHAGLARQHNKSKKELKKNVTVGFSMHHLSLAFLSVVEE